MPSLVRAGRPRSRVILFRRCGVGGGGGLWRGGRFLGRLCVSGRVLSMRRIRGWVGAGPKRPRVATRGYTRPLRCSSIRMACMGRFVWLPTPTAASQLSTNPRHCGRTGFFKLSPTAASQLSQSYDTAGGQDIFELSPDVTLGDGIIPGVQPRIGSEYRTRCGGVSIVP